MYRNLQVKASSIHSKKQKDLMPNQDLIHQLDSSIIAPDANADGFEGQRGTSNNRINSMRELGSDQILTGE